MQALIYLALGVVLLLRVLWIAQKRARKSGMHAGGPEDRFPPRATRLWGVLPYCGVRPVPKSDHQARATQPSARLLRGLR